MIASSTGYTTTSKSGTTLQNGDIIVSQEGSLTEVFSVVAPSPKNEALVDVVTDKGTFSFVKETNPVYTVLDDASLNAYYN